MGLRQCAVNPVETVHYSSEANGHEGYSSNSVNTDNHMNVSTTAVATTVSETVYYGS